MRLFDCYLLCCSLKFFSLFLDLILECACRDFLSSAIVRAKSFADANYCTRNILLMTRPVVVEADDAHVPYLETTLMPSLKS